MTTRRALLKALVAVAAVACGRRSGFDGADMPAANHQITKSPNRQIPEAFVFDAYGTLFDVDSVVALADRLFPGRGAALGRLWRAKQLEYSWLLTLMERYEDFWAVTGKALRHACESLDLICAPEEERQLLNAYLELSAYADVTDGLGRLPRVPLAILSNGSPPMLASVIKASGLERTFAHVISVDEVRAFKPSPRVYGLASARLRLEPDRIGFISSNGFDVHGAKSYGFGTYWINRAGNPPEQLGYAADVVVSSFTELVGVLNI
jgi:2-haloacid dehalogenase